MVLNYLQTIANQVFGRGELDHYRYYNVHVTVQDFKPDIDQVVYTGCPDDDCQKKVERFEAYDGSVKWYCPKCDDYYNYFQYRYKLKIFVEDGSRTVMVTLFDNTAADFLQISAEELAKVHYRNHKLYESYFHDVLGLTYYFTLKVALIVFEDRERLNCIAEDFQCDG